MTRSAIVLVIALLALVGASRNAERSSAQANAQPLIPFVEEAEPEAPGPLEPTPEPTTLLTASGSAFGATLAQDAASAYLLTRDAAYRLVPGQAAERWGLDLGISPALTQDHLLFWSGGALRRAAKQGGAPQVLADVPHQPQRLESRGDRFAWLDRSDRGRFTIWTLHGSNAQVLHAATGYVAALAMGEEVVYFVEQEPGQGWRLGAVPLSGGSARYTPEQTGRTPAMLAVARDVFYYDGPTSTVRRVSADLQREEVVVTDVICSPLAVAEHLYCAQPAGLLEIGLDGAVRRVVPLRQRASITAIAATATRLTWLMDVGRDTLSVQSISLTPGSR